MSAVFPDNNLTGSHRQLYFLFRALKEENNTYCFVNCFHGFLRLNRFTSLRMFSKKHTYLGTKPNLLHSCWWVPDTSKFHWVIIASSSLQSPRKDQLFQLYEIFIFPCDKDPFLRRIKTLRLQRLEHNFSNNTPMPEDKHCHILYQSCKMPTIIWII